MLLLLHIIDFPDKFRPTLLIPENSSWWRSCDTWERTRFPLGFRLTDPFYQFLRGRSVSDGRTLLVGIKGRCEHVISRHSRPRSNFHEIVLTFLLLYDSFSEWWFNQLLLFRGKTLQELFLLVFIVNQPKLSLQLQLFFEILSSWARKHNSPCRGEFSVFSTSFKQFHWFDFVSLS